MSLFTRLVLCTIIFAGIATRSQASIISYLALLDGPSESPPNASPGTGTANVDYDDAAHTLHVHVVFAGLLGNTTASHIHSATAVPGVGTAGVATTTPTFAGFPLGVTAGVYDNTLNMTLTSSWNPSYITANGGSPGTAEAALALGLAQDRAYLNVHSNLFPGGEIRGFLQPVPEPGSLSLLGLSALALRRRR